jgi:hypothetical protein
MSNTIELLETIGKDASLRHAPGNELAKTLAGMDASEGLKQAVITRDRRCLVDELRPKFISMVQSQIQGGSEDQEDEEQEPDEDRDDENKPSPSDS